MHKQDQADLDAPPADWDAADVLIRTAFQDVAAPQASLERARARLLAAQAEVPAVALHSQVHDKPPSEVTPRRSHLINRRRILAVALAAAVAAVALFYVRSRPVSGDQLISYCSSQAESIADHPPQWREVSKREAATRLASLLVSSNGKLRLVGFAPYPAGGMAESCRVWKFITTDGKSLYVFDFQSPRRVRFVTEQLQELNQSSGKWSLAGLQHGTQLVVVAVEGNVNSFFRARIA